MLTVDDVALAMGFAPQRRLAASNGSLSTTISRSRNMPFDASVVVTHEHLRAIFSSEQSFTSLHVYVSHAMGERLAVDSGVEGTGDPPHRWVSNRRIARVGEKLDNSSLSVTDIAHQCCFAGSRHCDRNASSLP